MSKMYQKGQNDHIIVYLSEKEEAFNFLQELKPHAHQFNIRKEKGIESLEEDWQHFLEEKSWERTSLFVDETVLDDLLLFMTKNVLPFDELLIFNPKQIDHELALYPQDDLRVFIGSMKEKGIGEDVLNAYEALFCDKVLSMTTCHEKENKTCQERLRHFLKRYDSVSFDNITPDLKAKITKSFVSPRPIAWVMTKHKDVLNLAPFSFFNAAGPDVLSLSVLRKPNGEMKDTAKNLLELKEAVIHIPQVKDYEKVDASGIAMPYDESEVEKLGLAIRASESVSVPSLKNTLIAFEVRLLSHDEIKTKKGDHVMSDFFLLRIETAVLLTDYFEDGYAKLCDLNLLSRLGGPYYGQTVLDKQSHL